MARGDQLVRQWSILHRLRGGRTSRRELAQEFGVSLKTILRDIDALSLFPITEEHEGIEVYYSLLEGTSTPGVWFEPEELSSLFFAGEMVLDALDGTPFRDSFASLLSKVQTAQRGHTHRTLRRLPEVFQVFASGQRTTRRIPPDMLQELLHAALAYKVIWMKYYTSHRQVMTERYVEPFVLYQSPHGFRLIGYCRLREDIRLFNINQIQELRVQDMSFSMEERQFDLEEYLSESYNDMSSPPVVDVVLRIGFPSAHWARDRIFHPTQEIEEREDGIEVRFRSGGMPAIAASVMGVGPDCYVVSPPALRQMVAERARKIASFYDEEESLST
jgi:predicted DNA-binding transcriptional regulator YafY